MNKFCSVIIIYQIFNYFLFAKPQEGKFIAKYRSSDKSIGLIQNLESGAHF
jgi:hypothetical protein